VFWPKGVGAETFFNIYICGAFAGRNWSSRPLIVVVDPNSGPEGNAPLTTQEALRPDRIPHMGASSMRAIVGAGSRRIMKEPRPPAPFADAAKLVIEPGEILSLVQEMTARARRGERSDWESSIAVLAEKYRGDPDRVYCISVRIRCLADMMKDARMAAWVRPAPELDYSLTKVPVFRATARCPLILARERYRSDPDVFFRVVLEEADAEGQT
jgi:hypothetical protein